MCPSVVGFSLLEHPVIACFRRNLVVSLVHRLVSYTVESDSKFKGQSQKRKVESGKERRLADIPHRKMDGTSRATDACRPPLILAFKPTYTTLYVRTRTFVVYSMYLPTYSSTYHGPYLLTSQLQRSDLLFSDAVFSTISYVSTVLFFGKKKAK